MTGYQRPSDLAGVPAQVALAPAEAQAFLAYDHAAKRDGGAVPAKIREMIALAVALTTQCAYCIDVHARAAAAAGVTAAEVAEVAFVAAAVRAGGTLGHALLAQRLLEEEQAGKARPMSDGR